MQILETFLTNLINNIFMFVFFFSCLYTIRHAILFGVKLKSGDKYTLTPKHLTLLGVSIAIIFTIIFSGIKLI
jgi:Na+-transporting NADH:ubiquinone oxidoreductase subunit NqrE